MGGVENTKGRRRKEWFGLFTFTWRVSLIHAFTFRLLFYSIFDCLNFNVIVSGNDAPAGDEWLQFSPDEE
jgi:hypothetical protein